MNQKWYRSAKFLAALVFLVLILIVWFAGSLIGLASSNARFAVIFLLMLLWVAALMIGKVVADRSSHLLEKVLRREADDAVIGASPAERAEMAQLRKRLLGAIETLKTSNLGRTRGKAALYELPWYMIVGHPAAGKSCAITNSGLKFPLAPKGASAIQGVGGTRNCDWFFSTEGVLLDTAGRYATVREDHSEWLAFLKLLKKHRSRAPLNGILVAVSLPELLQSNTESFASVGRQIRQRINEVDDIFGVKVPVYLIFTKLDLLGGFTQFFSDLSEEERQQAWGATLTHEQEGAGFNAVQVVGKHFDALADGLAQMGSDRLANSRSNLTRPALFAFPIEFNNLKAPICKLVEYLVEDDPYHTKPMIRGFYLTSALQAGHPDMSVGTRVTAQFGLFRDEGTLAGVGGSQPYFLESLFRKVIFPDKYLIGRQINPRRSRTRVIALAAGLVGLVFLAGAWTYSFILNQKLISDSSQELTISSSVLRGGESLALKLRALQILQARIELLQRYRAEGAPWRLRWGLYRGKDIERGLRVEYYQGLRHLLLAPVKAGLEQKMTELMSGASSVEPVVEPSAAPSVSPRGGLRGALRSALRATPRIAPNVAPRVAPEPASVAVEAQKGNLSQESYNDLKNALKTYLMLNQREHMESSHLADQLPRYWGPWLQAQAGEGGLPEVQRAAERTVAFFSTQIREPNLPLIDNDMNLVTQVRSHLSGNQFLNGYELIYNELKTIGNTKYPAVTVGSILENKDLDVVAGSSVVGGCFTREAWKGYIKDAIKKASSGAFQGMDWVLASSTNSDLSKLGTTDANEVKLLELYKADYIREWERFLTGVAVHPFASPENAAQALGRLGDPQRSPIKLLFARAAKETRWDDPSEFDRNVDSVRNRVMNTTSFLGNTSSSTPGQQYGEVGGHFAFLTTLTTPEGKAPVDAYLEFLQKLKVRMAALGTSEDPSAAARQLYQATLNGSGSEMVEGQAYVDNTLLTRADEGSRSMVRPILIRPLIQACSTLVPMVEQDLNRLWNQQVMSQWNNLASKYPFSDSTNDAPMSDIVRFLRPGEGTLPKFVATTLGPLVVRRGDSLVPRKGGWPEVRLNPAVLASISRLLSAGDTILQDGETCRFEMQCMPTAGIQETLLELDGQTLRYRNERESWTSFVWPNPAGSPAARLTVTSHEGGKATVASSTGRLGLMRLLSTARVDSPGASNAALEWSFRAPLSFANRNAKEPFKEETYPKPVKILFRMVSGTNPLKLTALLHHTLSPNITNQPSRADNIR